MGKDSNQQKLVRKLEALGASTRLEILQLLQNGALCVGAIAKRLAISQSAVSQHLRILKDAGLVTPERRSYFIHYRVRQEAFTDIMIFVKAFVSVNQAKCRSSECETSG